MSDKLIDADRRHFWHPFTQMKEYEESEPRIIVGAEGIYLEDSKGRRYIDGISSWWVNLLGHKHPRLDAALKAQIDRFSHVATATLTHAPAIRLARALAEITPTSLTRVFYSDDGSTAVETALKMVYQSWHNRGQPDRTIFVALEHAYHGDTLGAVSVGAVPIYHRIFKPLLFPVHHAPSPATCLAAPGEDPEARVDAALAAMADWLDEHHLRTAGVILEPLVQAAAGMYIYPTRYLKAVRDLCTRYDIPLIVDEVAMGFGRTGRLFACEHAGIQPDVMCLSKAITGGYLPLGVTLATDELFDHFYADYTDYQTFFHGHSYTGNPLGCALGLEVLSLLKKGGYPEVTAASQNALAQGFRRLGSLEHCANVRSIGMIAAVDLMKDPEKGVPFPAEQRMGYKVSLEALRAGLYVRPLGDVIYLLPPLIITPDEVTRCIDILEEAIRKSVRSA